MFRLAAQRCKRHVRHAELLLHVLQQYHPVEFTVDEPNKRKEKGQTWHCKPIKPKENGHSSGSCGLLTCHIVTLWGQKTQLNVTHTEIERWEQNLLDLTRGTGVRETHLDEGTVHHGTCEHLRLRTRRLFVLQVLVTDLTEAKSLLITTAARKLRSHHWKKKRFRPCCASLGPLWGWCSSGQTDWPQQPVGDCPP